MWQRSNDISSTGVHLSSVVLFLIDQMKIVDSTVKLFALNYFYMKSPSLSIPIDTFKKYLISQWYKTIDLTLILIVLNYFSLYFRRQWWTALGVPLCIAATKKIINLSLISGFSDSICMPPLSNCIDFFCKIYFYYT